MKQHTVAPIIDRPLRDARSIPAVVGALTGRRGLAGIARPPAPCTAELIRLALAEVLHTILELSGGRGPAPAAVELWVEPSLAVIVVRLSGPPLPAWLLANWDRGGEPAVLAPPVDSGWGWLLVREAFDGVGHATAGGCQLLFLEKRL